MFARTFALLAALFCLATLSIAQAQSPSLEPNPIITGVTQGGKTPTSLSEIKGYIGVSESAATVRVYRDLSLTTFYDIPRAAVVHSSQKPGDLSAEVTVLVPGDTIITFGATGAAKTLTSLLAGNAGGRPIGAARGFCLEQCLLCGLLPLHCAPCLACEIAVLAQ